MTGWRAVVDLGSLSSGLLLTDGPERYRRSIDTFMGGARLGPAGDRLSERIAAEALDRVAAALREFRTMTDERGAAVRVAATAAARRAPNGEELTALVTRVMGSELEIIAGDEEARLAFQGACSAAPVAERAGVPIVTIDLGGASTDFAVGTTDGPEAGWSMPIGASLVTRSYLHSDPLRPEELSAALSVVELHVDDLARELPELGEALSNPDVVVVGLGGVVTLAAVEIGLADVDPLNGEGDGPLHGVELHCDGLEEVFRTIATETRADRAHNPGLPPSRVDDVVGGCAVLVETVRQLGVESIVVSQRGLADGLLGDCQEWREGREREQRER